MQSLSASSRPPCSRAMVVGSSRSRQVAVVPGAAGDGAERDRPARRRRPLGIPCASRCARPPPGRPWCDRPGSPCRCRRRKVPTRRGGPAARRCPSAHGGERSGLQEMTVHGERVVGLRCSCLRTAAHSGMSRPVGRAEVEPTSSLSIAGRPSPRRVTKRWRSVFNVLPTGHRAGGMQVGQAGAGGQHGDGTVQRSWLCWWRARRKGGEASSDTGASSRERAISPSISSMYPAPS